MHLHIHDNYYLKSKKYFVRLACLIQMGYNPFPLHLIQTGYNPVHIHVI